MSEAIIHNVRFYKPKPKAIYCMAINKALKKLAVSRSDASIEIWNLKDKVFVERRIASCVENYSIEGLAWSKNRLFSVGLHALLIEYDLKKLNIKQKLSVTGQTAFCVDVNKNNEQLAVGTENGYINIFKLINNEVLFDKFLDKQEGRILCLKYDKSGNFIVSGGLHAIRVWNVETGHAIHRMTTNKSSSTSPTIVWCLAITEDFTIISGDSKGRLTFWDGKIGAQVDYFQTHKADILSVCLSEDENTVYCSGVHHLIVSYDKVCVKDGNFKWVQSMHRNIHDNDVRALTMLDKKLFSGGVDGYLARSYYPPKVYNKYPPILSDAVQIASEARLVLLKYPKHLEVWQLGSYVEDSRDAETQLYNVKDEPRKLLVLQKLVKSDLGEKKDGIVAASISDDGKWIVYSTHDTTRLFQFKYDNDNQPELLNVESITEQCEPCIKAVFTKDCKELILAAQSGGLEVIQLTSEPSVTEKITTDGYIKDTITMLLCPNSTTYLVASSPQSSIAVWIKKNGSWIYYCSLPKYNFPPTSMNINTKTNSLFITYSDLKIVEFDLVNRKTNNLSKDIAKRFGKHYAFRNITFDEKNSNNFFVHEDVVYVIQRNKEVSKVPAKIPKVQSSKEIPTIIANVTTIKKYKHLVHFDWLSSNELIAVEVTPLSLMEQLPAGFKEKKFGTK